jgi:hypothetical protein
VSRQSKPIRVPVIQKYPNSDQTLGLLTVGVDGGWSLKLPEYLTQDPRSNYRKQRFIDALQTHLHTIMYAWHKCEIHQVEVKLHKKVRPRYHLTLADNLPLGKAVRIVSDSMELIEFHHEQIVRLNQSRNQESLVEKRKPLS